MEVLKSVDMILAEDTRHSRKLLDEYGITTPYSSYHEHNEAAETPRILLRLREGKSFALISDAGTPLVSDPGGRLTRAAVDAGVDVVPIPGASAVLAAIVVSGIPSEQFTFVGFLPRKGKDRQRSVEMIVRSSVTTVLYEAPGRVAATLRDLLNAGAGERRAAVSRELTKKFEETVRGTVAALLEHFEKVDKRGEFVIVIEAALVTTASEEEVARAVAAMKDEGLAPREITDRLIAQFDMPRNRAYKLAHQ